MHRPSDGGNRRLGTERRTMKALTHIDESGAARMVDVSGKPSVRRTATATGRITMQIATVNAIRNGAILKGDVLAVARVAGINAAKKTWDLIPLCHNIIIEQVDVRFDIREAEIGITASAICTDKTGIEMEALTAVSIAALTIHDMCKAIDKTMCIEGITLVEKTKETV